MKDKISKIVLFCIEMFFSLVLLILSIMFTIASIHNINMSEDIKDFIDSCSFEFESNGTYYYSLEVDELDDGTITLNKINDNLYGPPVLGMPGDIFLMPQSRMEYFPFFSQFITYLFGGHAGVVSDNKNIIESMGGSSDQSFVYETYTDLFIEERTVVGLRVNASKEERSQAALNAKTLIGKRYNYWFILNTKDNYYCSDLCSRIYGEEFGMEYQIDTNGFHVSIQDLFRSRDTSITFVKYVKDGKTYIYYLKKTA